MALTWMRAGSAGRSRRLVSAALAIIIGVAFLTTTMVALVTTQRGLEEQTGAGLRDVDLVVTGLDYEQIDIATFDALAALPEVASVRGETSVFLDLSPTEWIMGLPTPPTGTTLLSGRAASAPGEILANPELGELYGVGEEFSVPVASMDDQDGELVDLLVVGIAEFTDPMLRFGPRFTAQDATLRQASPELAYDAVLIEVASGVGMEQARQAVSTTWASSTVRTGAEEASHRVAALTGDTDVMGAILLGFGAVALATAAIVIANTFTITLAQRQRELALLRAVGAVKGQVRLTVILEALALGLLASLLGVAVGIVGAQGLVMLAGQFDLGLPLPAWVTVSATSVLVPLLIGVVVTVLASLWPAVRATRVSPLAALRPAGEVQDTRRVGWVRLGIGALLVAVGVAAMVFAATSRDIISGVLGGLVSFVGILVVAIVLVPAAVRLLGLGARALGVPGRLAVDNAVRNPGRAAATSAALLVGVTLITMTSVGAASAERTALGEIDAAYAIDFVVEGSSEYVEPEASVDQPTDKPVAGPRDEPEEGMQDDAGQVIPVPLQPGLQPRLQAISEVEIARVVDTTYLAMDQQWAPGMAMALDPQRDSDVVRGSELSALVPGTLGLSTSMLAMHGLEAGDVIPVHGLAGSKDLRVVQLAVGYAMAIHVDDLAQLGGSGEGVAPGAALIQLTDDADPAGALSAINDVIKDDGLWVTGSATDRAVIGQVLMVLVLVTTGLLGVAVIIAVVGIANTLSLSVIERHREHALLRGLGLTRGQMQRMLLVEGVLLALVSAVIGLLLGIGYAALGVQTVLPSDTSMQLAIPWTQVGIIIAVAIVAGVLSSVLPARRAAKVSPAAGLVSV